MAEYFVSYQATFPGGGTFFFGHADITCAGIFGASELREIEAKIAADIVSIGKPAGCSVTVLFWRPYEAAHPGEPRRGEPTRDGGARDDAQRGEGEQRP